MDGVYELKPSLDEGRLLGGTACSSLLLAEACLAQGPLDSGVSNPEVEARKSLSSDLALATSWMVILVTAAPVTLELTPERTRNYKTGASPSLCAFKGNQPSTHCFAWVSILVYL